MGTKWLLAALIMAGGALQAKAADLTAIPRRLVKEPAYQGQPKYCLLVFGPKADTRIWLVLDGSTLYVDRNGDGDLTEAGERFPATNGYGHTIDRIVERDGTVHASLWVRTGNDIMLRLNNTDGRQQYVGNGKMERPTWGDKAATAPIIHFNGPMTFERYGPIHTLPRDSRGSLANKLRLMLGTPGLGKGTFASYDEICSENLGPIQADVEYANADPKGPPIRERVELLHDG